MTNQKDCKNASQKPQAKENPPLFTGNPMRDTSVSQFEKLSEAIQAIFDTIAKRKGRRI